MIDEKTYIIDPLTTLCKVSLLNFMPEKTKLAINHHVLYIQGYNCYQWLERMKNGDSRVDLSNLNGPFMKAVKWYIIDNPEKASMNQETSKSIKIITQFAIKGLIKLQTYTYSSDTTIKIILQYLINLLRDALNNSFNENNYIKIDNNSILSDKIKNNFEDNIINSVSKILCDAEKIENHPEDINALIDCAHKLLTNRDSSFVKLMKDINTG